MTDEPKSEQPASLAAPVRDWPALRTGAIRRYEDEALLARARARLHGATHPTARRPHLVVRAAAALIIFGVGVGVGQRWPTLSAPERTLATGPRAMAETPAGAAAVRRERPTERREARVTTPARRSERKRTGAPPARLAVAERADDAALAESTLTSPTPVDAAPSVPMAARPIWLELADRGDYAGALAELEQSRAAQLVLTTGSVEELMTMAEVARFAGNQERAIQALSQVVERYGRDPNAPLAAMMLGNLLSRAGDAEGAARAYAQNRALSPDGDFAEDALVREFDLALAAENASLASSLFAQYAREFPAGPHLYAMRYELDELLARHPAAAEHAGSGAPTGGQRSEGARPDAPPMDDEQDEHPAEAP